MNKMSEDPFANVYDLGNGHGGGNGGGNMLEARVARLESDVEHIKTNQTEARADIRDIKQISSDTNRDVAVILQKMVDMDSSIGKRPTSDSIDAKFSGLKVWFVSILLLSIAMPIITILANLYMRKP